jgi:hypothetical protein
MQNQNNKQIHSQNVGMYVHMHLIFVPLKPIRIIGDSDSWSSDNWSSIVLLYFVGEDVFCAFKGFYCLDLRLGLWYKWVI